MKVMHVVLLTKEHAMLHLRASWWARLFGTKDIVVELEYEASNWVSKYTRTPLSHMNHSSVIRAAMEGYPLEDAPLPAARLLEE